MSNSTHIVSGSERSTFEDLLLLLRLYFCDGCLGFLNCEAFSFQYLPQRAKLMIDQIATHAEEEQVVEQKGHHHS